MSAVLELNPVDVSQTNEECSTHLVIDPKQDLFKPWALAAMAAIVCDELKL